MQIVIDIPEILYTKIQNGKADKRTLETVILHGTPLPKGHGRLFDEKDIVYGNYEIIGNKIYELEPIIDAESEV